MKSSKIGKYLKKLGIVLAVMLCFACLLIGGAACQSGYKITVAPNDPIMGEVSCDKTKARKGQEVSLSATANFGYDFVGWYEDDTMFSSESEYVVMMPGHNVVWEGRFAPKNYTLTVTSSYEGFEDVSSGEYPYNSEVTLVANAIEGATFTGWYDEEGLLVSKSMNYTFVMQGDISFEATYFTLIPYELISLPEAAPAKIGTSLKDVALTGGETTLSGTFAWTDETQKVGVNEIYFVTFTPDVDAYPPCIYAIDIPLETTVLETPSVSMTETKLTWDPIEGATGYTIMVNEEEIYLDSFTTSYELPGEMGEYYVSVRAEGDNDTSVGSNYGEIIRYVPPIKQANEDVYGTGTSVYENGALKKFGGTVPLNNDNVKTLATGVEVYEDHIYVQLEVDITKHIEANTKREVLRLNKMTELMERDLSIVLYYDLWLWYPKTYVEVNMDFFFLMEDLEFGMMFESMTSTVAKISMNGEFVESQRQRETLHLLFLDLIGLEKPLYKWAVLDFDVPGTNGLLDVELSICFDAVGAVAASLYLESMEMSTYSFGLQLITNGVPVFNPEYEKKIKEIKQIAKFEGELDLDLTFVRLSASLRLKFKDDNPVSIVRLNADLFSLKTDLSGEAEFEYNYKNETESFTSSGSADMAGSYRFYGQVTFEYYFEIKLNFLVLPLDDFGFKVLDGSMIMAEWEYAKGGIPKTPYKDEAVYKTTAIYATDGDYHYFKDDDGTLLKSTGDYEDGLRSAIVDGGEIVDIDNYYVYVLSGSTLRRVGRQAGTERTLISGVSHVVGSDRNFIYYTTSEKSGRIMRYYRSDFESSEPVFVNLPQGWEAVRMRYDHNLNAHVIYAVHTSGTDAYFTFDGLRLTKHGSNEHAYWDTILYDNGAIAYYSMDKNGVIKECFIRYPNRGITHEDNFTSLGITPMGLVIVKEKAKGSEEIGVLPYEIGMYTSANSHSGFISLGEVANPDAARTASYYDGCVYITDVGESSIRVLKTDGKTTSVIGGQPYDIFGVDNGAVRAEMHDSWLFAYTYSKGSAEVFFIMDVETETYMPYLVDGAEREYDRANPNEISFTVNGDCSISALFINRYSEEDVKTTKKVSDVVDKVGKYIKSVGKVWSDVKEKTSETINFFNEYSDTYISLLDLCTLSGDKNLTISVPVSKLNTLDYGLYTGYIITTKGMFTIYVEVTDSRPVTVVTDTVLNYDKGNPSIVKFEVKTYDESLTGINVDKNKYIQLQKDIETDIFRFDSSYLSTLPYGMNELKFKDSEGYQIVLQVNVIDSRSPADSKYEKTFDHTFSKDLVFTFDLNDEKYITSVSGNAIPRLGAYYADQNAGTLTFYRNYLLSLVPGEYYYTVTTAQTSFQVTIHVIESVLPEMSMERKHDLATLEDLAVKFDLNDANEYFNVYLNGKPLESGKDYFYDKTTGYIFIKDSYLQNNVPCGRVQVLVNWTLRSGDNDYGGQLATETTLSDTRTPTLEQDLSCIVKTDNDVMNVAVRLYGKEVRMLTVNGEIMEAGVGMYALNGALDYRGGYIRLNVAKIADTFGDGTHQISVFIGDGEFTTTLWLIDERLPKLEANAYYYNVDAPTLPIYYVRTYGESLKTVSGNGITFNDYTWEVLESNPLYHVLTLKREYVESLQLTYGQTVSFTLTTTVNELTMYLVVYEKPQEPAPGVTPTPPTSGGGNYNPSQPDSGNVQITVASTPIVTPSSQEFDKSNPVDLTYTVNYGNNAFGYISYGYGRLIRGTHFHLQDGNIVLNSEWLSSLGYGKHTFSLKGARGLFTSTSFAVFVYDSADPYMGEMGTLTYDKYNGGSLSFGATMYDSKAISMTVNGVQVTGGFANTSSKFTFAQDWLQSLAIGTYDVSIAFNDSEVIFSVQIIIEDTTLYYERNVSIDKAQYLDKNSNLTLTWSLCQGSVEGVYNAPFTVVSFDNNQVVFADMYKKGYGSYTYTIRANGHNFSQTITIYDTRKPIADPIEYTFNKADYAYTLDPNVAKGYDLEIKVNLYDESFAGEDLYGNQTIHGNGLEYEDYDRLASGYTLSYLYLYRLRVGTYTYTIDTTDGQLTVKVILTDSKAPEMVDSNPFVYDYATGANGEIKMLLKGEEVSSVSYVHYITGALTALSNEQYSFKKDGNGNDVLVLNRSFLEKDFYINYDYEFVVTTTTERVLNFTLQIANGPKRPYRITYYSVPCQNGEPYVELTPVLCYEGDKLVQPTVPEQEYYEFEGFFTERSGGTKFDFSKAIKGDHNIFLRWKPKTYTITLYSDGGVYKTLNVQYLDTIPSFGNPAKTGYTFIKWATSETFDKRFTMEGKQMPHQNLVAYAEWELNYYTVTFVNANGVVLKEEVVPAFGSATAPTDEEMWVEHYVFKGWSGSYENVLSHRTLKGLYEAQKFALFYELNGGNNSTANPSVYTVEDYVKLNEPTMTGYNFLGWYETEDFSDSPVRSIPFGSFGSRKFYARWRAAEYDLIYDENQPANATVMVEGNMVSTHHVYGDVFTLQPCGYTLEGYLFVGWSLTATGTPNYFEEAEVTNLRSTDGEVILYARWVKVSEYNGHYYAVFNLGMSSWSSMQEYCESLGGYLATLTTAEEDKFLYNNLRSLGYTDAYIGFTDYGHEGIWEWVTGEVSTYRNWGNGEPNNGSGGQYYANYYFEFTDGRWDDQANTTKAFICEWGAYETPANGLRYGVNTSATEVILFSADDCDSARIALPVEVGGMPVTRIYANAFKNRADIDYVIIPDCIQTIDSTAFSGWTTENIVVIMPETIPSAWTTALNGVTVRTNANVEGLEGKEELEVYRKWEVYREPTCINPGEERSYSVTVDGAYKSRVIPSFEERGEYLYGHEWTDELYCKHCLMDISELVVGTKFNGHYYAIFSGSLATGWADAKEYCERLGGYLATVTSVEENDFLWTLSNQMGYTSTHFGLTDEGHEGYWTWVTGEAVTYMNWGSGQPDNWNGETVENYGHFWGEISGKWNDSNWERYANAFICEWGAYELPENNLHYAANSNTSSAILLGSDKCEATGILLPEKVGSLPLTRIYGNAFKDRTDVKYILIPASVTSIDETAFSGWTKDQYVIVMQDSVPSAFTNALKNVTVLTKSNVEIDEITEKVYIYTNWAVEVEPTCSTAGEERRYCINVEGKYDSKEIPSYATQGQPMLGHEWDENFVCVHCKTQPSGLFETFEYNGHHYALFNERVTWYEAYETCASLGGYLVTATTAEEQAFITNILTNYDYSFVTSGGFYYWEGLVRNGSTWQWITGEKFSYQNWSSKEPDSTTQPIVAMATPKKETANSHAKPGQWEDCSDTEKLGFICEWGDFYVEGSNLDIRVVANGGCTVYGLKDKSATEIVIPATYAGKPVTTINASAFENCTNLTSVTIGENITTIGNKAFYNCTGLTEINYNATKAKDLGATNYVFSYAGNNGEGITVTIGKNVQYVPKCMFCPNADGGGAAGTFNFKTLLFEEGSVCTSIGYAAFSNKQLTTAILPEGLVAIGDYAFSYCVSLSELVIPDSVTTIGTCAIRYAGIKKLTIGAGVKTIGDEAFYNCLELEEIYYNAVKANDKGGENYVFAYAGNNTDGITVTIGKNVEYIPQYMFCPNTKDWVPYFANIVSVIFEEGSVCTTIGVCAFGGNQSLRTLKLPNSLVTISKYAFSYAKSLSELVIPDSVTLIGSCAFQASVDMKKLTIGTGVKTIEKEAFWNCVGLEEIYYNAVRADDRVVDNYIFTYAGNKGKGITLTIGNKVEYVPAYMFCPENSDPKNSMHITKLLFEEGSVCTSIGYASFEASYRLHTVILPDGLTSMGEFAFARCSEMTKIVIPVSLKTVENYAFQGIAPVCYYMGTAEMWKNITIKATENTEFINAVKCYYSENEPALNSTGEMYNGNYWRFVNGEPTIWTRGVTTFHIGDEEKITDSGQWGLSQNNADLIDLSALSKYLKEGYTLLFEVDMLMHLENPGYQEMFLYTENKVVSSSTALDMSESTARKDYGLLVIKRFGLGEITLDTSQQNHIFAWSLSGEDCRSVMYLRWDAYSSGDSADTWIREDVVVRVMVLYDN